MNDGWYGALKEAIQQQQNQLVWVSEGKVWSFLVLFTLAKLYSKYICLWVTILFLLDKDLVILEKLAFIVLFIICM